MNDRIKIANELRKASVEFDDDTLSMYDACIKLKHIVGAKLNENSSQLFTKLADLIDPRCNTSCTCRNNGKKTISHKKTTTHSPKETVTWRCCACGDVFEFDPLISLAACPTCGEDELVQDDNA